MRPFILSSAYVVTELCFRPSGDWGSLPLEGGIEAAYKRKLDQAPTPAARDKMMKELLAQFDDVRNPMRTAHKFWVEEIIDPRDTRPMACDVSDSLAGVSNQLMCCWAVDRSRI